MAERMAERHTELASVCAELARETPAVDPERAETIPEAAAKLGIRVKCQSWTWPGPARR